KAIVRSQSNWYPQVTTVGYGGFRGRLVAVPFHNSTAPSPAALCATAGPAERGFMSGHRFATGALALLLVLISGVMAFADRLVLKDGRVVEGTVIKQGERYWVKSGDGTTQYILLTDVKS